MILYLELENCTILGTEDGEYIRFSKYNWYQIGVEGTYVCHGSICRVLEEKYKGI